MKTYRVVLEASLWERETFPNGDWSSRKVARKVVSFESGARGPREEGFGRPEDTFPRLLEAAAQAEGGGAGVRKQRYFVRENRECGDLILELRDREQEEGMTLIAEFYPHGWTNARYEVAAIAARLNGETVPSPASFDNERLADLERRITKLEKAEVPG